MPRGQRSLPGCEWTDAGIGHYRGRLACPAYLGSVDRIVRVYRSNGLLTAFYDRSSWTGGCAVGYRNRRVVRRASSRFTSAIGRCGDCALPL